MIDFLEQYDYSFPPEAVAQEPASPRDSARLLVYTKATDEMVLTTFRKLITFLPARSVLVVNDSKVIPARLKATRASGGHVAIFYLRHDDQVVTAMANRKLFIGEKISLAPEVYFTMQKKVGKYVELSPSFPMADILTILDRCGTTPLPPYIKQSPLSEEKLKEEYQTVFADNPGSVAAPTASLHFTPQLLQEIEKAGHDIIKVTLHVNLGTFAPLTPDQLTSDRLHEEWYSIDEKTAAFTGREKLLGLYQQAIQERFRLFSFGDGMMTI